MKNLFTKITAMAFLFAAPVAALAAQPFDDAAFQSAQAAGKIILIDIAAPWCPTCTKQKPIIDSLEKTEPQLVVFSVDFDSAKPVLHRFQVRWQSTLIVFKGETEVGRSTGETDPAAIDALVRKGL